MDESQAQSCLTGNEFKRNKHSRSTKKCTFPSFAAITTIRKTSLGRGNAVGRMGSCFRRCGVRLQQKQSPGSTPSGAFFTIRGAGCRGADTKLRFGEQQSSNQISGKQMTETTRLRIAMQKSGRLSDDSQDLLERRGTRCSLPRAAACWRWPRTCRRNPSASDDDIPGLVHGRGRGSGIIGENVLEETVLARRSQGQSTDFRMLRRFDFGGCRLSIAIPADQEWAGLESLDGCRIATSYPQLLKRRLTSARPHVQAMPADGLCRGGTARGRADAICDLVSSGATLEANGLREVEVVYRSKACLIAKSEPLDADKEALVEKPCACRASQGPANGGTSCRRRPGRRSSPK